VLHERVETKSHYVPAKMSACQMLVRQLWSMSDFKNLKVWKKAHILALDAQRVAGKMHSPGQAPLRNQIIRAAISIPTNIVEGRGQVTGPESRRFLRIALNSTTELEYHLIMARDTRAFSETESITLTTQAIEVRKMLYGLLRYLTNRDGDASALKPESVADPTELALPASIPIPSDL